MKNNIYCEVDSHLVELSEQPYDSENLLQALLAKHPNLLGGGQMDEANPRRWLLIGRELPIPTAPGSAGDLYLDHLLLDQEGIPTLVEVKRSSDTRIRREVVGQMLDYAANAVAYWPAERIRSLFEKRCREEQLRAEDELLDLLPDPGSGPAFWQSVKTNLQAGRIRMVFLADAVPPELRRIVEFLNSQMDQAEVLAVEVKRFSGGGQVVYVPHVVGQTAAAEARKHPDSRQWDEPTFFQELANRFPEPQVIAARRILGWARANVTRTWFGRGRTDASFIPVYEHGEESHQLFAVYTYGKLEIYFQRFQTKSAWRDASRRLEIVHRLNSIPGVSVPVDAIERRPTITLAKLADPQALEQFLAVFDWYLEETRRLTSPHV